LDQRISVRFETQSLSKKDTEQYIRHRLEVAGGASRLRFGRGTFQSIWRYSKGCPRLINLICDRALLNGYTERSFAITRRFVRKAAFNLKGKEDSIRMPSKWLLCIALFLIPAILLLSVLLFILIKK